MTPGCAVNSDTGWEPSGQWRGAWGVAVEGEERAAKGKVLCPKALPYLMAGPTSFTVFDIDLRVTPRFDPSIPRPDARLVHF